MILQALIDYAKRLTASNSTLEQVRVRWLVCLSQGGEYQGLVELLEASTSKFPKPKWLTRPFTSPNELSAGKKSHFLCDNAGRALGWADADNQAKIDLQHAYFQGLIVEAQEACPDAKVDLQAIQTFLSGKGKLTAIAELVKRDAEASHNITFRVENRTILDNPDIPLYWSKKCSLKTNGSTQGICLATGEYTTIINTHEKIKGVPGTGGMGANLIACDKAAFCHYGLEQAQNAPLSAYAEFQIRTALNDLIGKSRAQKLTTSNTIVLHWSKEPIELDPLDLINSSDPAAIQQLLHAPKTGQDVSGVDANDYYMLVLAGNTSRIIVQNWSVTSVTDVQRNVAKWFNDLAIIDAHDSQARVSFSLYSLLKSLVREDVAELPPTLPATLLSSALNGTPIPQTALAAALRRQNVDTKDRTNIARMALIKACLLRKSPNTKEITMTPSLNLESSDPAYLCGRLFAIFDYLQYLASGGVNAGVVERFYPSASATPALVMGRLFRNAQFHLNKVGGGAAENIRKELEVITFQLGNTFPNNFSLEEQGRFALGFYHQKAEGRRRRNERKDKEAAANLE